MDAIAQMAAVIAPYGHDLGRLAGIQQGEAGQSVGCAGFSVSEQIALKFSHRSTVHDAVAGG